MTVKRTLLTNDCHPISLLVQTPAVFFVSAPP